MKHLVASLELSKKLDMKLDTQFVWIGDKIYHRVNEGYSEMMLPSKNPPITDWIGKKDVKVIPAPTASELGEVLPSGLEQYYTVKVLGDWRAFKRNDEDEMMPVFLDINETTEANARAKMLIYLKEQGLLK